MAPHSAVEPLVVVSTYTQFENLAHAPKGTEASHGLYVYRLDQETGELTLLNVVSDIMNPAFSRFHPNSDIMYTVTESIDENGEICQYSISPATGAMQLLSKQCAGGTSTCYITIDKEMSNVLLVNYWDSSLGCLPIDSSGSLSSLKNLTMPDKKVVASHRDDHLKNRQLEPHAHAIVLDPAFGKVAYVPDLGLDVVKQYVYNSESGSLTLAGSVAAATGKGPHGPRYIEFHPTLNVAYVVNELSSTVSVFELNKSIVKTLSEDPHCGLSTLSQIQQISTIPPAFPKKMNTCGRIAIHPSGEFVLVSNRGHDSITVYKIDFKNSGQLSLVGFFHTRGRTPRHFQFDPSGKYVIAANQDTDSIAVFKFDQSKGVLEFTGNSYSVASPNFVGIKGFS